MVTTVFCRYSKHSEKTKTPTLFWKGKKTPPFWTVVGLRDPRGLYLVYYNLLTVSLNQI